MSLPALLTVSHSDVVRMPTFDWIWDAADGVDFALFLLSELAAEMEGGGNVSLCWSKVELRLRAQIRLQQHGPTDGHVLHNDPHPKLLTRALFLCIIIIFIIIIIVQSGFVSKSRFKSFIIRLICWKVLLFIYLFIYLRNVLTQENWE